MKFDELLFTHLGEMGRYQKIQFLLVCLPTIITAMHALSWTFAGVPVASRSPFPSLSHSPDVVSPTNRLSHHSGPLLRCCT